MAGGRGLPEGPPHPVIKHDHVGAGRGVLEGFCLFVCFRIEAQVRIKRNRNFES